jgi:hypothetical protein
MNYVQPDFRNPTPNPSVGIQPHNSLTKNPMALSWPIPPFVEKLSDKDDPQGNIRAGRSGKGGPG